MQNIDNIKILTPMQEELLNIFGSLDESDYFYLSGGTALAAFYLYHRLSEDLDIFTNTEDLVRPMGDRLIQKLEELKFETKPLRKFKSFYEIIASGKEESIRFHLAFDPPFRFEPPQKKGFDLKIDSLIDIATNKLLALWGRFEPRDFVDVYFLVKEKYSFDQLIAKAKEKDGGLEEYFLALSFHKAKDLPEDFNAFPVNMIKPLNLKEMKTFFIEKAISLLASAKEPGI